MPVALLDSTRCGQQDEYGYQSDKLATFLFQLRSELFVLYDVDLDGGQG